MRALQAPGPIPKAPPPRSVEEIIADFEATPPQRRSDPLIIELSQFPSALSRFQELDLSNSLVTDLGGKHLSAFTNLQSLLLANTRISDETALAISKLSGLEKLDATRTQFSEKGISSLVLLKNLRELRVEGVNLSDSGFARLGDLPMLEVLSARGCRGITGQQFTAAIMQGAYPRLRVLNVSRTRFGQAGLTQIGILDSLEHLNVMDCGVTDDGLRGISACKGLVILEASQNNFGPVGCAALSGNTKLRELTVDSNQSIKDECFNSLKDLRALEKLDVSRTVVTEDAVRLLKSKFLPRTTIQFNNRTF